jgi:hypothetical protein
MRVSWLRLRDDDQAAGLRKRGISLGSLGIPSGQPSESEIFFSEIGLYGYKNNPEVDFRYDAIIQKKFAEKYNPKKLFF